MKPLEELRLAYRRDEGVILRNALVEGDWYQKRAAEMLGIGISTFQRALNRHPKLKARVQKRSERRNEGWGGRPLEA